MHSASASNSDAFAAMAASAPFVGTESGAGVTLAVADWGFDLLHPALRRPRGSRFVALVDQNLPGDRGLTDGPRLDDLVEVARASGDRGALDRHYDAHANYYDRSNGRYGAHGTAMASIAAGSRTGDFVGLAPAANLVGIQLAHREPDWKEVDGHGAPTWRNWHPSAEPVWTGWRSYLDNTAMVDALETAWAIADRRGDPALVVNLAVGAWAGAHDGTSPVERKITEISGRAAATGRGPVTAVILTAGNAAGEHGHFQGTAEPGRAASFSWRMWPADPTPNKLEIWYRGGPHLHVSIRAPGGLVDVPIAPQHTVPVLLAERLVGIADHVEGASGTLSRVRILLHPPYFPPHMARDADGRLSWIVRCATEDGHPPSEIHAWVERDDGELERSEVAPFTVGSSLSGIACARGAIVVGACDPAAEDPEAQDILSGQGPRPWTDGADGEAPDVIAPGHRIYAARSKSSGFIALSGTSPAGALVAGATACVMSHALRAAGPDPGRRRELLHRAVQAIARGRAPWCPARGRGVVDIRTAIQEVLP